MVNKAIIIGHVGQDPEVRYVGEASNGTKVATFRVATTEKYKDRDGNIKENTEWHSVVAWRNLADIVEKYVRKGSQLYIEGKLQTRSWEDKTGVTRYVTDIAANTIQLLGKKETGTATPPQADPYVQGAKGMAQKVAAPSMPQMDNPEDDLPF
jgi:single-strand DNA-binding protein